VILGPAFRSGYGDLTAACESITDRIGAVRYAAQPESADTAGLLRLIGPAWLIVDAGLPEPLRRRISEVAAHLHLLMINEQPAPSTGQVILVGGGPGHTGLLTLDEPCPRATRRGSPR
jgi:hypothetical protein